MNYAVGIHEHAVDVDRGLPAETQQQHIHEYRGDTRRYIVQEVGRATGDYAFQHFDGETRAAEFQLQFLCEKRYQSRKSADGHTQAGRERRRPYAPSEYEQEQKFQPDTQDGHDDVHDKRTFYHAADAQIVVHREDDRRDGRAERIYAQILHTVFEQQSFRAHES